uniref:Uncharacterized protein n=1 Tax=Arundo donax TaxID=35708 RepID=A0A0A9F343_ARUDO
MMRELQHGVPCTFQPIKNSFNTAKQLLKGC